MRIAHIITKNLKQENPSRMIFLDTETSQLKLTENITENIFKVGCLIYWKTTYKNDVYQEQTYWSISELWEYIISKTQNKTKLYIFCHNLNFDFPIIKAFHFLAKYNYTPEKIIIENPPTILEFSKHIPDETKQLGYRIDNTIVFIDTLNYWRLSLAQIGESIGFPKQNFDIMKVNWSNEQDKKEVVKYCMNDTRVLYQAIKNYIEFIRLHNLGNFSYTLPSQSFNAFRHKFMKKEIYIHNREDCLIIERNAYMGARVECYRIGEIKEKIYYLDINSLYPYVMRNHNFPVRILWHYKEKIPIQKITFEPEVCYIAECKINTKIPVFPMRSNGKLIFPIGRFKTTLNTGSLKYAIENNLIDEIESLVLYESSNIFCEFIDFFYKIRLEYKEKNNFAFQFMSKYLMNQLYGKFGQMGMKWQDTKLSITDKKLINNELNHWSEIDENGESEKYRYILGVVQKLVKESESTNSFPAIAGHVTDYGRLELWRYMNLAGLENVYYCDTDSIFVNESGYQNLKNLNKIDDKTLGLLKLEKTTEYLRLNSCKDYIFDDKITLKGISPKAKHKKDSSGFELPNEYIQEQFISLLSQWNNGVTDRQMVVLQEKKLSRIYDKGEIKNGLVLPFKRMDY